MPAVKINFNRGKAMKILSGLLVAFFSFSVLAAQGSQSGSHGVGNGNTGSDKARAELLRQKEADRLARRESIKQRESQHKNSTGANGKNSGANRHKSSKPSSEGRPHLTREQRAELSQLSGAERKVYLGRIKQQFQ
jgi:hypothetical protein